MNSIDSVHYGVCNSRRLLVQTIQALEPFRDALTVIGAHAVHLWVTDAWGAIDMQATRDADTAINPVFVLEQPKVAELLNEVGVSPALENRPGIYGFTHEMGLEWSRRTTIDLIVHEVYAGAGKRAARIHGQKHAATRARGLELVLWDRHRMELGTFDEPHDSTKAYVSGPAALLIAKAHKIHERLLAFNSRPERLRPKDSGDVALLMMVSDASSVAQTMVAACLEHPEITEVIQEGSQWLLEMYSQDIPKIQTRQHAADSLAERFNEDEVFDVLDAWTDVFRAGSTPLFD